MHPAFSPHWREPRWMRWRRAVGSEFRWANWGRGKDWGEGGVGDVRDVVDGLGGLVDELLSVDMIFHDESVSGVRCSAPLAQKDDQTDSHLVNLAGLSISTIRSPDVTWRMQSLSGFLQNKSTKTCLPICSSTPVYSSNAEADVACSAPR